MHGLLLSSHICSVRRLSSVLLASIIQDEPLVSIRTRTCRLHVESKRTALVGRSSSLSSLAFGPPNRHSFACQTWILVGSLSMDFFSPLSNGRSETRC